MSLDNQVKKLQQLIDNRSRLSLEIDTSYDRLMTMIRYDPTIGVRGDLSQLYRQHQADQKLNEESFTKCNRDIGSLLKIMMRGGSSEDRIAKMTDINPITQAMDRINNIPYEFLIDDNSDELTLEQLAVRNPIISLDKTAQSGDICLM